jgi:hypothetical protein
MALMLLRGPEPLPLRRESPGLRAAWEEAPQARAAARPARVEPRAEARASPVAVAASLAVATTQRRAASRQAAAACPDRMAARASVVSEPPEEPALAARTAGSSTRPRSPPRAVRAPQRMAASHPASTAAQLSALPAVSPAGPAAQGTDAAMGAAVWTTTASTTGSHAHHCLAVVPMALAGPAEGLASPPAESTWDPRRAMTSAPPRARGPWGVPAWSAAATQAITVASSSSPDTSARSASRAVLSAKARASQCIALPAEKPAVRVVPAMSAMTAVAAMQVPAPSKAGTVATDPVARAGAQEGRALQVTARVAAAWASLAAEARIRRCGCGGPDQPCCPRASDWATIGMCSTRELTCSGYEPSRPNTCLTCGGLGAPCCSYQRCQGNALDCVFHAGTVLDWYLCESCGEVGQPCCLNRYAAYKCHGTDVICDSDPTSPQLCAVCGISGGPCCPGETCRDSATTCFQRHCVPCGLTGQPCCPDGLCDSGCCISRQDSSVGSGPTCVATGAACEPGAPSSPTYALDGSCRGETTSCGGMGQDCCASQQYPREATYRFCSAQGSRCTRNYDIGGYTCGACGDLGQQVCLNGTTEQPCKPPYVRVSTETSPEDTCGVDTKTTTRTATSTK